MPLFPVLLSLAILVLGWDAPLQAQAPGGWVEPDASAFRTKFTPEHIRSFMPARRGSFTFPFPYGTQAARISDATDCRGSDCLFPIGYSYWRNTNNHAGSDDMLIFLSFDRRRGGAGPTLFRYDKTRDTVTKLGPLFDPTDRLSWASAEGWYFSATRPTALYLNDGPRMIRYDVNSRSKETVFDVTDTWGPDKSLGQMHSSNDDLVHSAVLRIRDTGEPLGCLVYHERTGHMAFFPKIGIYGECLLDKSGHWLISLENIDGQFGADMRVFDLANDEEIGRIFDREGAVEHGDVGYGYLVGADDHNALPNASLVWYLGQQPAKGPVVHYNANWNLNALHHLSHANAKSDLPAERQFACGSNAEQVSGVQNEITCVRLDGSRRELIVAPVLTSLEAPGGVDLASKMPKGNLDITGEYFIWTTNLGGSRLDAVIVKVPFHLLFE
ncbi:MAG TPA: hypothetical protein VFS39_16590 [Nitrospira sp.]|nr:hypothetical protein [Nitrospira sp.]